MLVQACCRALPRWTRPRLAAAFPDLCWTPAASVGQQHCSSYSVITSPSNNSTLWRYPADEVVKKMADRVEAGHFRNTCGFTLNMARPVSPDVFKEAMVHLTRKVETLQICLRQRDGHLWVAKMETPKMDFQVLENGHLKDLFKVTAHATFNVTEGLLWRARLLCPPEEPCKMPQVKDAFPHQYHFVIDVHHSLSDGLSLLAMAQIFFTILDDLLDGAEIDDNQVGELRDGKEIRAAEVKIKETLEKDPQRLKVLLEDRYKLKTRVPLITETFGVPQEPSPTTCINEMKIMDDKLLQMFNAKCKAHKVTLNSGFAEVKNVALVELIREAGMVRDTYTISTRHPVNTRRYMSDVKSMVWAYHGLPMTQTMTTPWNVRKNFWKYVADFHAKFCSHVNKMGPLEERILDTMLEPVIPDHGHMVIYEFYFAKMHSLRVRGLGSGKHVHPTDILNYTPLTQLDYWILCGFSVFRDHMRYQLFNSSGYITAENAAKFSSKTMSVFSDIAKAAD